MAALEDPAEAVRDKQFAAGSKTFIAFNAAFGKQLEGSSRGGPVGGPERPPSVTANRGWTPTPLISFAAGRTAQCAGAVFRMEQTSSRQIVRFPGLSPGRKANEEAEAGDLKKSRNEGKLPRYY